MPEPPERRTARRPGRRGVPSAWLAAAAALVLVFFLGFVVGRGGGEDADEAAGGARPACERAMNLAVRAIRLHRQALANRVAFAEAVARGDEGDMRSLDEALTSINERAERVFERSERVAARCRGEPTPE